MWTIIFEAFFTKSPYACGKAVAGIETPLNGVIPWMSLLLSSIRHRKRQSLIDNDGRPESIVQNLMW